MPTGPDNQLPGQTFGPPPDFQIAAPPTRRETWREIMWLFGGAFLFTALAMHVSPNRIVQELFGLGMGVCMIWLPVRRVFRRGLDLDYFGLDWNNLRRPFLVALKVSAVVFPLYWLGIHLWSTMYAPKVLGWVGIHQPVLHFHATLPHGFLYLVFSQIILVAFPEEFFFRGYLQTRLEVHYPRGCCRLLGVEMGPAIFWSALLFAAIHLAWIPLPFRLLTFFPGLLFCWLRRYTNSIFSSILFHGLCNIVQQVLAVSYIARG